VAALQGLQYNFQGGGTVQLCEGHQFVPVPLIFWAHVSIAGFQIINDRLNVLSMIFMFFFSILSNFVKAFNVVNL